MESDAKGFVAIARTTWHRCSDTVLSYCAQVTFLKALGYIGQEREVKLEVFLMVFVPQFETLEDLTRIFDEMTLHFTRSTKSNNL